MYVTRPLSRYLADPKATAEPPPEGPGSGFLVVLDEATEQASTLCCGLCLDPRVRCLPFPQNRQLSVKQGNSSDPLEGFGKCIDVISEILGKALDDPSGGGRAPGAGRYVAPPDYVMFVPVIGQPLSSGRYYVVKVDGKHTGKVSACSKEEDRTECCFRSFLTNVKPRAFDHGDVYQQMQVQQHREGFKAAAVAADGIPPDYLLKKGWTVVAMAKPKYYNLADDARGVDSALRDRMPDLGSLGVPPVAVVVGRWYVPFLFVKADGERLLKDQVRKSTFYKMTMEQSWEQIYSRENATHLQGTGSSSTRLEIAVTATVRRFTALLGGTSPVQAGAPQADDGAMWFRPATAARTTVEGVGLDMVLWERMRWEVERGGRWVAATGNGDEERIQRTERRDDGLGHWSKFGCYLLVERFVLRRMDGTVALTCEFRHTDKIKAKWL
ncbi:uncharacterized protein [Miscanthus floridulus]|uniref:uncharacterized protein n=1 Tax=Miscanthus floridulus TaxID=154761 RepID=UPI0034590DCC